jgi:type II secretory pathway component PulF
MLLMGLMCVTILTWALSTESEVTIFLTMIYLPLLFLTTIVTVLFPKPDRYQNDRARGWAKGLLFGFVGVLFAVTCAVVLTSLTHTGFLVLVVFVALVVLIAALISYNMTSHRAAIAFVVSTIGSSIRQNLPLPMALEAACGRRSDRGAQAVRRIQKWLVQGYSLSEAVRVGYPQCPAQVQAMIAVAEHANQLPQAFESLSEDMAAEAEDKRRIEPDNFIYPLVLLIILFSVTWGVMTFVIPSFVGVMTEMTDGATLPGPSRFLLRFVGAIVYDYGYASVFLMITIALVGIPLWIRSKFRPRRPHDPYSMSQIGDWIKWHLPISHWFQRNYSLARTVEVLKLSLGAESTVDQAISNTIGLDINACFKKKLGAWLGRVERGDNISDAARKCGLGSAIAWAFDDKINKGNTLSVLEALESFYRCNYSYRVSLARFILWPSVTLCMALIIGFVVYSIYSVPIAIIHETAKTVYP